MLPFKKILFPVDYSAPCQAIVPYVREMRHRFSATLTLVHAYGVEALFHLDIPIDSEKAPEAAQKCEEIRLRQFARDAFPGEHAECFARLGEAGAVIEETARRQGVDLVMIPTHGRGVVRRLLLGSVTAKVLHDMSCAVWTGTTTEFSEHSPQVPYESILCALDDSEESGLILTAAAALAGYYQAELRLVHAIDIPFGLGIDYNLYLTDMIDNANRRIRELKDSLNVDAPHTVLAGTAEQGICEEAIRRKADLIVTGRGRAQAPIERVWSRLYRIVRESPCPVISV